MKVGTLVQHKRTGKIYITLRMRGAGVLVYDPQPLFGRNEIWWSLEDLEVLCETGK